jgi:hypothetical protein
VRSLHSFITEHNLPKTTVRRWLNANGFSTSEGLDDAAENAAYIEFVANRKMPEVTIVDEVDQGITIDSYDAELTFNPAALVGMTHGTDSAIEALRQVQGVTAALRKGVQSVGEKAKADYLKISGMSRDVLAELEDLQHTLTEVRASSTVLETMKIDRLNDGLAAKTRIDELRGEPK